MATQLKWQLVLLAVLCYQSFAKAGLRQVERIINGLKAEPKQFPYQVFLEGYSKFEWGELCGGVIISNRIILTAAHCFLNKVEQVKVIFGAVNRTDIHEYGQQRLIVPAKNIVLHEEYDDNNLNDIAIIKLPADLQFNAYIQPAKLPKPNQKIDNKRAVTSGFGCTKVNADGPNKASERLMYLSVKIIPNEQCWPLLINKYKTAQFFPSSWTCIAPSNTSPCFGDSGGPLVIQNTDGSNTLVGLTAFGLDAFCSLQQPEVYTRVSSFLNWIKTNSKLNKRK